MEPRRFTAVGHRLSRVAVGIVIVISAATFAVAAAQADPIEGIWSFGGGEVAIQGEADGSFQGIVVAPTKFSQCFHPVGERVWTGIREQADGSYWGRHHWFFATEQCVPNPNLGLTAWRVLTAADGSRQLRVCFSEPGSPSQPMIAPSGIAAGAAYGCQNSARISALPGGARVKLPGNTSCRPPTSLRIRIRAAKGDPLEKVSVTLRSGKVVRRAKLTHRRSAVIAKLNLVGLPSDSATVRIRARTVLGKLVRRHRAYNLCALHGRRHGHRPHKS
jgi:hypothetical protein